jgi:tetratricopeptide (TPR) repeat protein
MESFMQQLSHRLRKFICTDFLKKESMSTYLLHTGFKRLCFVLVISVCLLFVGAIHAENYTLEEGKRLFDQEKYELAKDVLLKVIEQEPENAEANSLLCKVFFILDGHDKSIKYGKKAVKLDGSVSDYHLWLGRAHGTQA